MVGTHITRTPIVERERWLRKVFDLWALVYQVEKRVLDMGLVLCLAVTRRLGH